MTATTFQSPPDRTSKSQLAQTVKGKNPFQKTSFLGGINSPDANNRNRTAMDFHATSQTTRNLAATSMGFTSENDLKDEQGSNYHTLSQKFKFPTNPAYCKRSPTQNQMSQSLLTFCREQNIAFSELD